MKFSNKQIKIIKFIKKHPELPDILKKFDLINRYNLRDSFPPDSLEFDVRNEITYVYLSHWLSAEYDDYIRTTLRFWLPLLITNALSVAALVISLIKD